MKPRKNGCHIVNDIFKCIFLNKIIHLIIQIYWNWFLRLPLTHWGRVMHICVGKLTIIGSDNGLLPGWCQAIIWTNAGILLIWPLGTNFNEILFGFQTFSFKEMHLKMSSAKWRPFCLGLNVLRICCHWFRWWLRTEQMRSDYLNQWSLMA